MSSATTPIDALVESWLAVDVNPVTRKQILDLHEAHQSAQLEALLSTRIAFGTAGLRARMEAGYARMNDVTVLQASQGLAAYVAEHATLRSIVVGHDHRHNSKRFAELTAGAFLRQGMRVYYLGETNPSSEKELVVATPLVPFSVDHFGTGCGVMITASHNPAADNGYKVYWGNGCQIIPPHDAGIAQAIDVHMAITGPEAWDTAALFTAGKESGLLVDARDEMITAYTAAIATKLAQEAVKVKFMYTPMHGVGLAFATEAFKLLGIHQFATVKEQELPDPNFSTVKFPNPEEKGALSLAMAAADAQGLSLVLANDPDADRFSVAVKVKEVWRQLTGNEIGFLFAAHALQKLKAEGADMSRVCLLNSTVSSQMIGAMAASEGCRYQDTLTGFKWIGNKAIDFEAEGYTVPFAYEEAIGYMFLVVHDKDGISAAVVWLQMEEQWARQGTSAVEQLEQGYAKYGFFKEHNGYYVVPELSLTQTIFDSEIRVRDLYPQTVGKFTVASWRDLTTGFDSTTTDGIPVLPSDSSSQMITASLTPPANDGIVRFTARGSGTEPKLKVYIEGKAATEARAAELALEAWSALREAWFKPSVYGLQEVS